MSKRNKSKERSHRMFINTIVIIVSIMLYILALPSIALDEQETIVIDLSQIECELNIHDELVEGIQSMQSEINALIDEIRVFNEQKEAEAIALVELIAEKEYRIRWYRNVGLAEEYQVFLYEVCLELDIDYELQLARMMIESDFNPDAIGYNKREDGTVKSYDVGLNQVNSGNFPWMEDLGLDVVNNVYDNITGGCIIYLDAEMYGREKGYEGESLFSIGLTLYNMGLPNYLNYVKSGKDHSDWKYTYEVLKNRDRIITMNERRY